MGSYDIYLLCLFIYIFIYLVSCLYVALLWRLEQVGCLGCLGAVAGIVFSERVGLRKLLKTYLLRGLLEQGQVMANLYMMCRRLETSGTKMFSFLGTYFHQSFIRIYFKVVVFRRLIGRMTVWKQ